MVASLERERVLRTDGFLLSAHGGHLQRELLVEPARHGNLVGPPSGLEERLEPASKPVAQERALTSALLGLGAHRAPDPLPVPFRSGGSLLFQHGPAAGREATAYDTRHDGGIGAK